jgi:hypothetical protein
MVMFAEVEHNLYLDMDNRRQGEQLSIVLSLDSPGRTHSIDLPLVFHMSSGSLGTE